MSFWEKALQAAKDIGTSTVNSLNERANEIRQLKEKYELMSDDELIQIVNSDGFFSHSQTEKGAAFGILKARGRSTDDMRANKA